MNYKIYIGTSGTEENKIVARNIDTGRKFIGSTISDVVYPCIYAIQDARDTSNTIFVLRGNYLSDIVIKDVDNIVMRGERNPTTGAYLTTLKSIDNSQISLKIGNSDQTSIHQRHITIRDFILDGRYSDSSAGLRMTQGVAINSSYDVHLYNLVLKNYGRKGIRISLAEGQAMSQYVYVSYCNFINSSSVFAGINHFSIHDLKYTGKMPTKTLSCNLLDDAVMHFGIVERGPNGGIYNGTLENIYFNNILVPKKIPKYSNCSIDHYSPYAGAIVGLQFAENITIKNININNSKSICTSDPDRYCLPFGISFQPVLGIADKYDSDEVRKNILIEDCTFNGLTNSAIVAYDARCDPTYPVLIRNSTFKNTKISVGYNTTENGLVTLKDSKYMNFYNCTFKDDQTIHTTPYAFWIYGTSNHINVTNSDFVGPFTSYTVKPSPMLTSTAGFKCNYGAFKYNNKTC